SALDSVGSPYPLRTRSPCHTDPVCVPAPSTVVSIVKPGPSAVTAAYVTASFSFDAGMSGSAPFRSKTVGPVERSRATAPVAARLMCGTRSADSSDDWSDAAAPDAQTAAAASAATTARQRTHQVYASAFVGLVCREDGPPGPYRARGRPQIMRPWP